MSDSSRRWILGQPAETLILVGAILWSMSAEADLGYQLGIGHTDNIDRIEFGGRSEQMLLASVGGNAATTGAGTEGDVRWAIGAVEYLESTYDSELVAFIDGDVSFDLYNRRIFWHLSDQLGRQSLDSFNPTTPDSREYVNFFSTGPDFVIPISDLVALDAGLDHSDVWYEGQTLGNSRNTARIGITMSTRSRQSFGIYARKSEVSFDEQELHEGYDREQVFLQYQTRRSRGVLQTAVGRSRVAGLDESRDGTMFEGTWTRSISASSNFILEFRKGLSDSGELFQFSQINNAGVGIIENLALISSPIEMTYGSVLFDITRPRIGASVSFSWLRQEHEDALQVEDRASPVWNVQIRRRITPRVDLNVTALLIRDDFENLSREDRERRVGFGVAWRLSSRSQVELQVARFESESTVPTVPYEEDRIFVTFSFGAEVSAISSGI